MLFGFFFFLVTPAALGSDSNYQKGSSGSLSDSVVQNLGLLPNGNRKFFAQLHISTNHLDGNASEIVCGGGIIDPSWVITTASCIKNAAHISIEVGDFQSPNSTRNFIPGDEAFYPEGSLEKWKQSNDIALVRLTEPVDYTFLIPICETDQNHRQPMLIIGYGKQQPEDQRDSLIEAAVKRRFIWSFLEFFNNQNDVMSVRYLKGKRICLPQVGGPVVTVDWANHQEKCLYGVVNSFFYRPNQPCPKPENIDLVHPLYTWIKGKTQH